MTNTTIPSASDSGLNLDHLEALARGATPGPWKGPIGKRGDGGWNYDAVDGATGEVIGDRGVVADEDLAFIAAANPAAVLELIALARRAAPVSAPIAGDARERFEAWAKGEGYDVQKTTTGHYYAIGLDECWKAVQAALANQPAPTGDEKANWCKECVGQGIDTDPHIDGEDDTCRACSGTGLTNQSAPTAAPIPVGGAIDSNGMTYHNVAEIYFQAETCEALHHWLDNQGVPRADADGKEFSPVGRVKQMAIMDGERFRWLNADHEDLEVREKARELASRLGTSSYFAITRDIDAAMGSAIADVAPTAAPEQVAALEGRIVSVDVSTGEEDALNRIYAELTGETASDGETLIAIEQSRNFSQPSEAAPLAGTIDTPEFRELLVKVWNGAHPRLTLKSVSELVAHIDGKRAAPLVRRDELEALNAFAALPSMMRHGPTGIYRKELVELVNARLASLAHQPAQEQDDPYALDDDDEVRFPNDTQVAIISVKRYYELRGFEEAQVAQEQASTAQIVKVLMYLDANGALAWRGTGDDEADAADEAGALAHTAQQVAKAMATIRAQEQAEPVAWRFREYDDREKCHSRTWCITMDRGAMEIYKRYDAIVEPLYAASPVVRAQSEESASTPKVDALRLFLGAAYPVHISIDPRGYSWSEAYLDQARAAALAQYATGGLLPDEKYPAGAGLPMVGAQQVHAGADEVPAWKPVTSPGQVEVGARLRFTIGDKQFHERAKLILHAGTDKEEVIYDKGRNFYFITAMVMSGFSNHKGVEFLPPKRAAIRAAQEGGAA